MSSSTTSTEIRTDFPNSVEVNKNAKGEYSWGIKAYGDNDLRSVIVLIKEADTRLRELFRQSAESIPEKPPLKETPAKNAAETPQSSSARPRRSTASKDRADEDPPKGVKEKGEASNDEFNTDEYDWDGAEGEEGKKKEPPEPVRSKKRTRKK